MREQHIHGDVGQVVGGDVHVHAPRRARPTDPNTARVCPQCRELTWRLTRHCGTCELDLVEWDALQARRLARLRARERLKRLGTGLGLLAGGSLWVGYTQRDWLWQAVGTLLLVCALRAWGDWLQR